MEKDKHINQADVFEIMRMSTEDGPGIRTTVLFQGLFPALRLVSQSGKHFVKTPASMGGHPVHRMQDLSLRLPGKCPGVFGLRHDH